MPDENTKQLVLEFVTNAAEAAYEVKTLGKNLDGLGDKQREEAAREKSANAERTRAASNLRQILEAMLGQLKQMNTALGDVSAASVRTADTAEKAFKKAMTVNRALRMEKQRGDREENRRQVVAKENFIAEQSRNHDRLRTLKLLAAGGAVLGVGKMAFNVAFESAGRGMALLNTKELTGVDPAYLRAAGWALRGRNGSDDAAMSSISALSQVLFRHNEGLQNISPVVAKYLGNIPFRGTIQEVMEYLADRLPQLNPQQALAAGSAIGLNPEIIALLRNAGGAEGWRKMLAEGEKQTAADEKTAESVSELKRDSQDAIRSIQKNVADVASVIVGKTTPEQRKNLIKDGIVGGSSVLGLALINKYLGKYLPWLPWFLKPVALGAGVAYYGMKYSGKKEEKTDGQLPTPYPSVEDENSLLEMMRHKIKPQSNLPPVKNPPPLTFNLRQFEDMIRNNPFNYMTGRDYFNLTNGGASNTDNSRQFAVNVENINITTRRDDPAAVADATQDGLNAAALRLIDRHMAGVYNV